MTKFDVIGFGALNVDTLLKVDKIAGAEEESFIQEYTEACGGSAANTIVGLARLGCNVGFLGKVADDHEGQLQVECFQKEGVNTDGIIHSSKGKSGVCLGFVDRKGARALYINPGVNDFIEFRKSKRHTSPTPSSYTYPRLSAINPSGRKETHEFPAGTVKVSFDPGSLYAQKGLAAIEPIIQNSFVMMPNTLELQLLTGETGIPEGAQKLIEMGVEIVAVKMGDKGCYVSNGEEKMTLQPYKVPVVDTTGAGDAFDAGFLYGLVHNRHSKTAANWATL